ncbi:MAG: GspH/FimT family pseudopilin [Xanthomonadales bacterium]|jgi:general secretion pathway protein H|nr:GspH/FimT family pseudopilin [Xanthomonadales bacterium]
MSPRATARLTPGSTSGPRHNRGFTLVEVLVVMIIIALVLGLVATSLSRSISGAEAREAARNMVAAIRYTRTQAILQKTEQRFTIDLEARSYAAPGRKTVVLPEGVDLQLTTAASEVVADNVGAIRFFPDGGSTGGRVDLNVNGREYIVHVAWLTGEARLEIPDDGA